MDTRGRWHGSLDELVEAFQAEVTCLKFVTYRKVVAPPKGRNRASRLRDIQQILGHRLLFRRLRALHDKLCFRATDVTAALKIISEQRGWFYENPGHRDAWSVDLSAMVRSMLRDIRQAMICSPNGAWLRKLWGTSKSPQNTPEPVAETVLDVDTLTRDDSQMLVEDAQPRKLENVLAIQDADTVESKTDYFVWFDLELGTAWRSCTGSPPEQAATLQVPENARGWSSMVGVWSDGWRHELVDISVDEYKRRCTVSSSPSPSVPVPVPVPVEKTPAVEKASAILWTGTHARLGTKIKVVRKKQGVHPTLVAIVVPKNGGSRERQVCQALMEPDSNVTVMIEIAKGFAQDLYQEGDLYDERDKRIQLPRMKRPAGIRETGVSKRRAVKAEEAESEAPLSTLSTHNSDDDDDRDIDVSRVNELPLGLVSPSLEEQLEISFLSQ